MKDIIDNTILKARGELELHDNGDSYRMTGGQYGDHVIPKGDWDRLLAHWDGYCRANGWRPKVSVESLRAERGEGNGEGLANLIGSPASWKKHLKGRS